jgi:hypothetical protein
LEKSKTTAFMGELELGKWGILQFQTIFDAEKP